MFTRAEFLEALSALTTIERGDAYALVGYLMVIGPIRKKSLRSVFWPMIACGGFDARLHFLVQHQAVHLRPDRWGGDPLVALAPEVVELVLKVNLPAGAPTG